MSGGFGAWLVKTYGLDGCTAGRRRVRGAQRRPIGNNYTYHAWNRTAHRRLLFGPLEKTMIVQIAKQICRQKKVQLHVYKVMGNHLHLVLTTQNDVSISELMQQIDWHISIWYNRVHGTSGALWEGPFKHSLCEATAGNLLRLINYVHANALRAGLVSDAEQYTGPATGITRERKGAGILWFLSVCAGTGATGKSVRRGIRVSSNSSTVAANCSTMRS